MKHNITLSIWDAIIVSAAFIKNASIILTEDLQKGQCIEGMTIVNPCSGVKCKFGLIRQGAICQDGQLIKALKTFHPAGQTETAMTRLIWLRMKLLQV